MSKQICQADHETYLWTCLSILWLHTHQAPCSGSVKFSVQICPACSNPLVSLNHALTNWNEECLTFWKSCERHLWTPTAQDARKEADSPSSSITKKYTMWSQSFPWPLESLVQGFLESLSQELWVFVLLLVHHFCHVKKPFSVPIFRHTYLPICENMWKYVKICENMWKYVKICENMWKYVKICENMWKICEICEICENMWKYVKICENKIPSFPTEVWLPMPASPSSSMSSRLAVERQTWCPSFVHEVFLHVICGRCVFMLNRFTNQRW